MLWWWPLRPNSARHNAFHCTHVEFILGRQTCFTFKICVTHHVDEIKGGKGLLTSRDVEKEPDSLSAFMMETLSWDRRAPSNSAEASVQSP